MIPDTYVIVEKDRDGRTIGYLGPFKEYTAAYKFACDLYRQRELVRHSFMGAFRIDTIVNPANLEKEEN